MDALEHAFDQAVSANKYRRRLYGRLGYFDKTKNLKRVRVTDRPGYAYVRIGDGVNVAKNMGAPYRYDLPVILEEDADGLIIVGADPGGFISAWTGSGGHTYSVAPHTHKFRSGLDYEIEGIRIDPGRIYPVMGQLKVGIRPFRYQKPNGAWETFEGGMVDISTHKTELGDWQWRWVIVGVNTSDNTTFSVAGPVTPTFQPLEERDLDNIALPSIHALPCGAVRLRWDDTQVTDPSRYADGRGFVNLRGSTATTTIGNNEFWDAKGDLAVGTGPDTAQRLPVGVDTSVLVADSSQTTGVSWTRNYMRVFNVKHYGATGDGATDDTAACQAAIDAAAAAGGGTVYFPPGTYVIGGGNSLKITASSITLAGAGIQATYIRTLVDDATYPIIDINPNYATTGRISAIRIQDMHIGRGSLASRKSRLGVRVRRVNDSSFINMKVAALNHYGMYLASVAGMRFLDCFFEGCGHNANGYPSVYILNTKLDGTIDEFTNGISFFNTTFNAYEYGGLILADDGTPTTRGNRALITSCRFIGPMSSHSWYVANSFDALTIDKYQSVSILGNIFQVQTGFAIVTKNGALGINVLGNTFAASTERTVAKRLIDVSSTTGMVICGNQFTGASGGGGIETKASVDTTIVANNTFKLVEAIPVLTAAGTDVHIDPTYEALFSVEGPLSVAPGSMRIYNLSRGRRTIQRVFLSVATAPQGSSIIVDVNKNGTTIFTNQANRPQIAPGANTGETTTIDVPAWNDGDYLTVDVDQVGSTASGSYLTVHIICS